MGALRRAPSEGQKAGEEPVLEYRCAQRPRLLEDGKVGNGGRSGFPVRPSGHMADGQLEPLTSIPPSARGLDIPDPGVAEPLPPQASALGVWLACLPRVLVCVCVLLSSSPKDAGPVESGLLWGPRLPSLTPSEVRLQTQSHSEVWGFSGCVGERGHSPGRAGPPLLPVFHLQTSRSGCGIPPPCSLSPRSSTWFP